METRKNRTLVGIADDRTDFTMALSQKIVGHACFRISFCVNDGEQLLSAIAMEEVDVLVVHLFLPFLSGMEAIRLIRKQNKDLPIIAFSATYQEDLAAMLSGLGNIIYCQRNLFAICQFLTGARSASGEGYQKYVADWELQNRELVPSSTAASKQKEKITGVVQLQVLALIVHGLTNQEIADLLRKSKRSIDSYIETMIQRLDVKGRVGLAFYAYQRGVCKVFCNVGRNGNCDKDSMFTSIIGCLDTDRLPR